MNTVSIPVLATALFSLITGIWLALSVRKQESARSPRSTNRIAWLLIALFPVLVLFSFFPNTDFRGTLLGFSATGAGALFILIWYYGSKGDAKDMAADREDESKELNDQILILRKDLEKCQDEHTPVETPRVFTETEIFRCPLLSSPKECVGLITGNLGGVNVADIWVNSENTNMQLSRWYDGTISGTIRYLGSEKDHGGEITEDGDFIALALKEKMGSKTRVEPTTVLMTPAGALAQSKHNVKAILHVASVQGSPLLGYRVIPNVEECVTTVLDVANSDPGLEKCRSIVFPLMGSGHGQADVTSIAQKLLTRAISYLEKNPKGRIHTVYFLTWTDLHLGECRKVLKKSGKVNTEELDRVGNQPE